MATLLRESRVVKIVLIGDGGVGKSCITMAILKRHFQDEWDPTIEDRYTTQISVDGVEYTVELVDTAGQEDYRGLWQESVTREGDGFIFVYAIDDPASFELVPQFLHAVRKARATGPEPPPTDTPENTPFPFLILGNKCDLQVARHVSAQSGFAYAKKAGGLFYECSARQRVNIDSMFQSIVRAVASVRRAEQQHKALKSKEPFNANIQVTEQLQGHDDINLPPALTGVPEKKSTPGCLSSCVLQ